MAAGGGTIPRRTAAARHASALAAAGWVILWAAASSAAAQVTLFEGAGYAGRALATNRQVGDFRRSGLMGPAGSAIVERGLWEICDDAWFSGSCVALRPGRYANPGAMGLVGPPVALREIKSSGLMLGTYRFAPAPQPLDATQVAHKTAGPAQLPRP